MQPSPPTSLTFTSPVRPQNLLPSLPPGSPRLTLGVQLPRVPCKGHEEPIEGQPGEGEGLTGLRQVAPLERRVALVEQPADPLHQVQAGLVLLLRSLGRTRDKGEERGRENVCMRERECVCVLCARTLSV